jgi:hypothetical protein
MISRVRFGCFLRSTSDTGRLRLRALAEGLLTPEHSIDLNGEQITVQ